MSIYLKMVEQNEKKNFLRFFVRKQIFFYQFSGLLLNKLLIKMTDDVHIYLNLYLIHNRKTIVVALVFVDNYVNFRCEFV